MSHQQHFGHHTAHFGHQAHHHHMAHHAHGFGVYGAEAAAVIVSGVPEHVALHSLWVLLEVYGNVMSLKRQYSQKTNVVAIFQNTFDARGVVVHLQNCPFFGSSLQLKHFAGYVDRSKTEWNMGPSTDPMTQAFSFHECHHRTKPSAPFNHKQKCHPEKYLFVSNLSEDFADPEISDVFGNYGFKLLEVFRKSPRAAIVSLSTVPEAVEALIAVHAANVKGRYLSVAFSRFPPGQHPGGEDDEEGNQVHQAQQAAASAVAQ